MSEHSLTSPPSLARLRHLRDCCAGNGSLEPGLARWLQMSIDRYLARESESLEAALGLKANHGGLTWWRREAIHERDLALCHLATAHFSDLPPTQQARAIAVAARRYGACGWRSDQRLTTLPSQEIATVRGHLFRAFKSGAPMPLCERQVRNILRQKKFTVTQQGHSSPKPGEIAVTLA